VASYMSENTFFILGCHDRNTVPSHKEIWADLFMDFKKGVSLVPEAMVK
jgi:hypothetical protein